MAITAPSPLPDATDFVLIAEASALFDETGHPVPPRTLKRWAVKHGVAVAPTAKGDIASWSDLLEVHAAEVDRRIRRGSR
jgi:hypothetical protein